MTKLIITIIRHGESVDNTVPIWAGWKDAQLSESGKLQAQALGLSLSSTRFKAIYASPLLRASQTADAVHFAQLEPKPPLIKNTNLREQHFGIAEGHTYVLTPAPEGADLEAEYYNKKLFPVSLDRKAKFPEGESLEDVAVRVQEAIKEVVVPHLLEGQDGTHIAIVSHGLCIKEILAALNLLDPGHVRDPKELGSFTSGLVNTGWTQVVLTAKEGESALFGASFQNIETVLVNQHEHLDGVPHIHLRNDSGSAVLAGAEVKVQAESNL